jgi:hypothetical protein
MGHPSPDDFVLYLDENLCNTRAILSLRGGLGCQDAVEKPQGSADCALRYRGWVTVREWRTLRKWWGAGDQVGWQSYARRRWYEVEVDLGGECVGDPAEPGDGQVRDGRRPVKRDAKRQVHAQGDGGGGEGLAANHPAAVRDGIASQNEPHG